MKKTLCVVLLAICTLASPIGAKTPDTVRERIDINENWKYQQDDPKQVGSSLEYKTVKAWLLPSANRFVCDKPAHLLPEGTPIGEGVSYAQPGFNDENWRRLNLPHDWAIEQPFDIGYNGATGKLPFWGIAWYRKTIDLPAEDAGKSIFLDIDGAMSYAMVWCNGKFAGGWPYGYASFSLDLTAFVKPGQSNTIAIRLDNPDLSSRWYPGAGIYRNVWLVKTSPVRVAQWSTFAMTKAVTDQEAVLSFQYEVENAASRPANVEVATDIFLLDAQGEPSGRAVASIPVKQFTLDPGKSIKDTTDFTIPNPKLWDLETPHRYVAVTRISQDGKLVDRYQTRFGVRSAEFTIQNGFLLNGRRVPIQGVCMHHDLGALGGAFNTRAQERQLEILKEMGVNTLRTSHNVPAPELVELCDRMGLMLQLELTDSWQSAKTKNDYNVLFDDWSEPDMRAMVRHYRNNPSVIMWSIGNEIPEQTRPQGGVIAANLHRITKEEDPSRPTSMGSNRPKTLGNPIVEAVDIWGINYSLRSYSTFRSLYPFRRVLASETASTVSTRGEYYFPVTNKRESHMQDFQISSYDKCHVKWGCTPDVQFDMLRKYPAMYGEFAWTGFDYLGEPTPYNNDLTNILNFSTPEEQQRAQKELEELGKIRVPSRSSYFGIVDLAGFKKDRFYSYQAHWRKDYPMAHILPHWSWPGREGEITPVHVYTSGNETELFLNGQSLGRRTKAQGQYRLQWDEVKYQPGELRVVAYKDGHPWAESSVHTAGEVARMKVEADRSYLTADGYDLAFVTVTLVDKNGVMVPRANNELQFGVSGAGELIATDNGDPTSFVSFQSPVKQAFNGLCLGIVRTKKGEAGSIHITVKSEGLPTETITVQSRK